MGSGDRSLQGHDSHRPKLIVLVADLGRYPDDTDARPPAELRIAWDIKRWGALPEAGGLLDQPAGVLRRAGVLSDIYDAHRDYYQALMTRSGEQLEAWETANIGKMKIMAAVREIARGLDE